MSDTRTFVGKAVECVVCGRKKKPVGRSAPAEMANSLCDHECEGYWKEPIPGQLWPNETQEDFGYCVACGKPLPHENHRCEASAP